ncbi:uncharacterized protein DMAD_13122 [Drosophila madeirensis]|uniref:Uncharacterized protein n=1 Tax=Drosophila madeirensis TaxID=30013 RepID=A0AAU9FJ40_DROMD
MSTSTNQLGQRICQLIQSQSQPINYEQLIALIEEGQNEPLNIQEITQINAALRAGLRLGFFQRVRGKFLCLPVFNELQVERSTRR